MGWGWPHRCSESRSSCRRGNRSSCRSTALEISTGRCYGCSPRRTRRRGGQRGTQMLGSPSTSPRSRWSRSRTSAPAGLGATTAAMAAATAAAAAAAAVANQRHANHLWHASLMNHRCERLLSVAMWSHRRPEDRLCQRSCEGQCRQPQLSHSPHQRRMRRPPTSQSAGPSERRRGTCHRLPRRDPTRAFGLSLIHI